MAYQHIQAANLLTMAITLALLVAQHDLFPVLNQGRQAPQTP